MPRRPWEVLLAKVKPVLWKDVENAVLLDSLFVTEEQMHLNRDSLVKPLFLKNHQMIRGFNMLHGNARSIYPSTLGGILCICCKWLDWYSIFTNTAVWNNDSGWDFDWNISMSTDYSPKKSQLSASACSYRQMCCDCMSNLQHPQTSEFKPSIRFLFGVPPHPLTQMLHFTRTISL